MIGHRHRGALLILVERKSRFSVIEPLGHRRAALVREAIRTGLARDLDARVYFAHPYASWERGANENTHGLIRQYFPKARALHTISRAATTAVMNALNHYPREALGFRTPHEVFFNISTTLTVALES